MIFISYRRDDTKDIAGRLYESLISKFGRNNIFYDAESIEPGSTFPYELTRKITNSKIVLVLIGKRYLSITDDENEVRLFSLEDFVNKEVGLALRSECVVIPILVDNTDMPSEKELPENLSKLAYCNAVSIDWAKWSRDIEFLANNIRKILSPESKRKGNFIQEKMTEIPVNELLSSINHLRNKNKIYEPYSSMNYIYGEVVNKFSENRGSMYEIEDGNNTYFCNYSDILTEGFRTLRIGDKVRFAKSNVDENNKATYVLKIEKQYKLIDVNE
ncbi:MAG: hypothetical protein CL670_07285 [Balneola sp.]|jgi:cold shock CspA family protein|nr:hypothetical protein [Balneola sp.]MBE78938.1 hypothetical protein [Balneola sp.]|tara:strand:- start:1010 stop:1828 length:819 start_codon:yes stop_codon:yes gene_type:complete